MFRVKTLKRTIFNNNMLVATPQRTKVFKRAEREFIQQFDTYEPRPVNEKCLRCLCSTTCSDINNNNCAEADCLKISRDYWIESGSPEVRWGAPQNDDPYLDCASDFDCSVRSVQGFMHRFQEVNIRTGFRGYCNFIILTGL